MMSDEACSLPAAGQSKVSMQMLMWLRALPGHCRNPPVSSFLQTYKSPVR